MPRSSGPVVPWTVILWLATLLNIGLGVRFSDATRIRIIRVSGCHETDKGRLEAAVRYALKTASRPDAIVRTESAILVATPFQSVTLQDNPFGRAYLQLRYRKPVATVEGTTALALDAEGVLFPASEPPANVPTVRVPNLAKRIKGTLLSDWLAQPAAEVAVHLAQYDWGKDARIDILPDGEVSFIIREQVTVRLGSTYDLNTKLAKFDALLAERPKLLEKVTVLTLMVPSRPTVVLKKPQ